MAPALPSHNHFSLPSNSSASSCLSPRRPAAVSNKRHSSILLYHSTKQTRWGAGISLRMCPRQSLPKCVYVSCKFRTAPSLWWCARHCNPFIALSPASSEIIYLADWHSCPDWYFNWQAHYTAVILRRVFAWRQANATSCATFVFPVFVHYCCVRVLRSILLLLVYFT